MSDEIISSYSREQAIEDGVLAMPEVLKQLREEAGFKAPVAFSSALWQTITDKAALINGQDIKGRLWDVLTMAKLAFQNFKEDKHLVPFEVLMLNAEVQRETLKLWLVFNEGEGFTVMFPEDY